ncbi:MAG: SAF domain-containing protein, partial [Planctomycetota bacterium]
ERGPIEKMGKKLVAAYDMSAGHVLKREDIALKSPGDGVEPYRIEEFIGMTTVKPVKKDADINHFVVG